LKSIERRAWAIREPERSRGGFAFTITPEGRRIFDADYHFRRHAAVPEHLNDGSMPVLESIAR
jgi:hypothetical protein